MSQEIIEADEFFNQEVEHEEQGEAAPTYEGVCSKCLGSKYVIVERNGIMGVLYTSESNDSEGKPIRRLVSCDCEVTTTY